ncbi:MAG: sigma-54-dependent Fis family transcriptional regulator [bacterium]|nr:sigma-54-dependent Fis family transcriptional regulator [bacterium]
MSKILIIEDDGSVRESLIQLFLDEEYEIRDSGSGTEGLETLKEDSFDLIITDMKLGDISGLEVIERAKEIAPSTEIILITAYGTVETAVTAIKKGAYDYITKPFELDEILLTVERALEKKQMSDRISLFEKELKDKYKFEEIVASSEGMLRILKTITKICDTDSTVLVTGPSGTGKELIGKAIHYNSNRNEKPLVILNCGAIPENLHESELFGHKKGSFTGAEYDKKGLFEEAENGTIILDEIGELSGAAQVKLLRFLQNKEIRRVGENKSRIVDVRIIAMTNRDLQEEVRIKNFREDLYFRLNVIPIKIPPLLERKKDIDLLIEHFIDHYREKLHKPGLQISRRSISLLKSYNWPGNVRELENVIERSAILCEDNEISPEDLPFEIAGDTINTEVLRSDKELTLEDIEKQYIKDILVKVSGNRNRAADMLGISRATLFNKLKKYEIK